MQLTLLQFWRLSTFTAASLHERGKTVASMRVSLSTSTPLYLWSSEYLKLSRSSSSWFPAFQRTFSADQKQPFVYGPPTKDRLKFHGVKASNQKKRLKVAMSCSPTKEPFQVKESHQRKTTWSTSGQAHCKPPLFFWIKSKARHLSLPTEFLTYLMDEHGYKYKCHRPYAKAMDLGCY